MLLGARLTWCTTGTAEGTGGGQQEGFRLSRGQGALRWAVEVLMGVRTHLHGWC